MNKSVYSRPDKPMRKVVRHRHSALEDIEAPKVVEPLMLGAGTECHVTPFDVVETMIDCLTPEGDILEPSVGTGNILKSLVEYSDSVTAVESNYNLIEYLRKQDFINGVDLIHDDFLKWAKETACKFDCIFMNPPFKTYKKHLAAAESLLKSEGNIIAIVPASYSGEGYEVVSLDNDTFKSAKVFTKIIHIER